MMVMKNTKRVNGAKRTQSYGNNSDVIHNYYRALESLVKTTVDGRNLHCIGKMNILWYHLMLKFACNRVLCVGFPLLQWWLVQIIMIEILLVL